MIRFFFIDKEVGETPLHALERGRKEQSIEVGIPLTYAGRLDPMASGKLLILVGEECKKQENYRGLDKEYVIEVLFGIGSDTGDILGIPTISSEDIEESGIAIVLDRYKGDYNTPYPAFSSKPVQGKPLFQWALENRLSEIEIPLQHGKILSITKESFEKRSDIASFIFQQLDRLVLTDEPSKRLGKNFRIDAVREAWQKLFEKYKKSFPVLRLRVKTTSGVYMRTLAEDIAKDLGSNGLALSIHRTEIFLS